MVDCYVIRRKSDGKLYPIFSGQRTKPDNNRRTPRIFKAFHSAVDYYNSLGRPAAIEWEPWSGGEKTAYRMAKFPKGKPIKWDYNVRRNPDSYLYSELELVKFSSTGEVVVCSGKECLLTTKDAKKLQPIHTSPLTSVERRAGINEEIGLLLNDIEAAEKALEENKSFDLEKLSAQIEVKKIKLQSALDELTESQDRLRSKVRETITRVYE